MREAWDRLGALPSKAAIRTDVARYPREYLLDLLQWNDQNGCFTDKCAEIEGFTPFTKEEAVDEIVEVISDSMWPETDPRRRGWSGPKEWRPKKK